jgi:ATP-dependent DNA ligase
MMAGMPVALMLATLTERRGFGDDFLLERKFDGERCVARKDRGELSLESRTGNDLTLTYPEVGAAVSTQGLGACYSTARSSLTTAVRLLLAGCSGVSG